MKKINIAIDGYSSCGKSTLAKQLAKKLGYVYIDTGAMYRAIALFCMENNLVKNMTIQREQLENQLPNIDIDFKFNMASGKSETYLNNQNTEHKIRTLEVSNLVSKVASIKAVRKKLVALQQRIGKAKGVVMDGRDIGTVVLPEAELKLFMTADVDIRAQRRLKELQEKGDNVSLAEVKENIAQRDYDDTHREEDPLIQAKDAIVLDNSNLTPIEQLEYVVKLVKAKL